MKTLYTWVLLAGAGMLPACTVNYYGVPGGHAHTSTHTYETDTVYVNNNTTTVITQSGTVGGPAGGYAGNGPVRQPPVRGGYGQPGGVRTTPGSYPPPRTNGGVRPEPGGQTTAGPVRTTPGNGPVRGPGHGGSATPGSGSTGTNGGTNAGTGGSTTGQTPHDYQTGGIKPIPTSAGSPVTPAPVKPETAVPGPPRTGGIKPVRPTEQPNTGDGQTGSSGQGSDYQTGGIKPIPNGSPAGGNGGVVQPPVDGPTGGIKPVKPTEQPNGGGSSQGGDFQTGGIKPVRENQPTGGIKPVKSTEQPGTGGNSPAGDDFQTGGIKPIPPTATPANPTTSQPQGTEVVYQTGGIKPIRESQPAGSSTETVQPGSMSSNGGTKAAPVLMFAKMPCRGYCPSYTATIWPNGRVVYVGQANVEHVGTYELRMEPATVASIQQQAQSVNFNELPGSFASGNADIPATMLTMYGPSGSSKTVSVEDNAPAEVQALYDYIHNAITQVVASSEFSEERAPRRGR